MRIGSLRTDGRRRSAVAMRWALGGDGGGTGGTGGGGWTNRRAGIVRGGSTAPLFARVRIRITRLCCSSLMGLCTDSANSPCGLRENAGKSPNGGGESASSSPAAVSSGSSGGVGAFGRWDASRPMDVTLGASRLAASSQRNIALGRCATRCRWRHHHWQGACRSMTRG